MQMKIMSVNLKPLLLPYTYPDSVPFPALLFTPIITRSYWTASIKQSVGVGEDKWGGGGTGAGTGVSFSCSANLEKRSPEAVK